MSLEFGDLHDGSVTDIFTSHLHADSVNQTFSKKKKDLIQEGPISLDKAVQIATTLLLTKIRTAQRSKSVSNNEFVSTVGVQSSSFWTHQRSASNHHQSTQYNKSLSLKISTYQSVSPATTSTLVTYSVKHAVIKCGHICKFKGVMGEGF